MRDATVMEKCLENKISQVMVKSENFAIKL